MSILGNRVLRREDPALLTGQATYVENVDIPGAAYVTFVRSPIAHARITELDVEEARTGRYDRRAVAQRFRELEFRSLIDRLPASSIAPTGYDSPEQASRGGLQLSLDLLGGAAHPAASSTSGASWNGANAESGSRRIARSNARAALCLSPASSARCPARNQRAATPLAALAASSAAAARSAAGSRESAQASRAR